MRITGESETGSVSEDTPEEPSPAEPTADEPTAEEPAPAEQDVTEETAAGGNTATASAGRRHRFRRAVAIALLFALAGAALQVMSWRARHSPADRNRALTDAETTSVVIGDVSNGLSKVFSYAPDSTATTEQAAADVLGGNAASQYRTLFAQVKQHAAAERLTLTTRVVQAGVTRLSGDTAHLLVFLDQLIVRKDTPAGTSAAAQLSVTARLDAGHWRIIDIHAR